MLYLHVPVSLSIPASWTEVDRLIKSLDNPGVATEAYNVKRTPVTAGYDSLCDQVRYMESHPGPEPWNCVAEGIT